MVFPLGSSTRSTEDQVADAFLLMPLMDSAAASSSRPSLLSERRRSWMFIRVLLEKNWLLKRRHYVATALEILLPMLFIVLLGALKKLTDDTLVPDGWSDGTSYTGDSSVGTSYNLYTAEETYIPWVPTLLPKFNMHETSLTGLILMLGRQSFADGVQMEELSANDSAACGAGLILHGDTSTNASSPYFVPSACAGKVVPYKIGIAPDTTFTRAYFMQTMAMWYPRITVFNDSSTSIPSFEESVQFFDTADALEEYVSGSTYGKDMDHPKIYSGIVFDSYPGDSDEASIGSFASIEYTLRLNSTRGRNNVYGRIPPTSGDPVQVDLFQRAIDVDIYSRYAVLGFMTLQTLVTRFVTCMPEWDPATKTTPGVCQRVQATALNSSTLSDRLFDTYRDDTWLSVALDVADISFDDFANLISASAKEQLVVPLRQVPQPYLGARVAPFPVDSYVSSSFYDKVKDVFALVFILAYLYSISQILVVLIKEKELRLREFMKILGVKEKCIIISWFITYTVILLLSALLQALAGTIGLFANSSIFLIWLFFSLFGISVLAYGYLVSTIFSRARAGSFVGMVVFFLMYFVSVAFTSSTPEGTKTLGCIISPVALAMGVTVLANLESTGQGISFGNIDTVNENFRFSTALFMFVFDTIVYTLLGLYFERVVPREHGTTLKWYFPLSPSYWRGKRKSRLRSRVQKTRTAPDSNADAALLANVVLEVNPNFEPVSNELREQEWDGEVLAVQRLRKTFSVPGGEKVAVRDLNLTMYKNQITCLLGHNGAGKTTLISMLTGMIAPSSGNATFHGLSLKEDMDTIRESLGICFQHDVLFEELTVEEHLRFFAQIKGYTKTELQAVVDQQIEDVGLTEKRDVPSNALSGGMKRKLSVAVSLLGDSSLVFLDEPTSGMDPYSRRSTWEILLNNRNNRVMVLTTHFMDEADILGDRIAIMAEGELRCCGSSLFLKNRYGAGYNLTLVKSEANCKDSDVIAFVGSFVPSTQLLSNVGSEISFQLPLGASHQFATMFASMDESLQTLGLLSYGISVTTLEEVFIKVAEANDEDNQHTLANVVQSTSPAASTVIDRERVSDQVIFQTHLRALILKRFRVAKRDKKMLFYSLGLPVFLLLAGLALLQTTNILNDDPRLALTTDAFTAKDQSPTPYYCQEDAGSWCSNVMSTAFYSGSKPQLISDAAIPRPAFDTNSPTVFNVNYTDPVVNGSDATGYGLRLGEQIFNLGYGRNGSAAEGQYGAYLVYGAAEENLLGYNVFTNTSATHGSVIYKSLMDQSIYRFFASNTSSDSVSSVDLKVNTYPLPLTASSKALYGSFIAFTACIFVCIAFTYFPASIVVFLVKERQVEHNSKHQQLVSGVSLSAFWASNFIWDLMTYVIPFVAAIVLIQAFNISAMTGNNCVTCTSATFPAVVLLLALFGFAICPFTYCMSYMFKEHSSSQTYTIMINFIIGTVLMVVSFILDLFDSTKDINYILKFIWRFSPLFNLGNGLLTLTLHEMIALLDSDTETKTPFSGDIMLFEIIYLAWTAILFGAFAVGVDYAMTFPRFKQMLAGGDDTVGQEVDEDDVDVLREAQRVADGGADQDIIKLQDLRKVYPGGKFAVRNLSFGLPRGECFGFLGINGAGKTTTMKMLTGDIAPTHGTATLCGFDMWTQQMEVRREIGYCPQFDALFELLTVREHLELFASIKGIVPRDLDRVVDEKIQQLNLTAFQDKLAGSLSGGNKRKLSVAIAMIGNPRIIFLDEPSTGMDPVSRRFMWDVIAGISTRTRSSTIVLTTHSMEEAEALCSRVGIMVGGRFRCLGSVQHLKTRFGDGLVFDVKLRTPSPDELVPLVAQYFTDESSEGKIVVKPQLEEMCAALGKRELADRIVASHATGYNLAAALTRDGFIRASAFCSWCVEELRYDALLQFLEQAFGGSECTGVQVMERQNDFCSFKLRGSSEQLKLAKVFALIERVQEQLHIREYSISQTTLEQIFNYFASQQSEELGVARGVFQ